MGRRAPTGVGHQGGDDISPRVEIAIARLIAALAAILVAFAVGLSAWLTARNGFVVALAAFAAVCATARRPGALGIAMTALACAAGVALHDGAPAAAAPLWGVGLLVVGCLAERALAMPPEGEIEVAAVSGWLAALGALAGAGLAGSALVLLARGTNIADSAAGLAAGALLAVVPAALSRRLSARSRDDAPVSAVRRG